MAHVQCQGQCLSCLSRWPRQSMGIFWSQPSRVAPLLIVRTERFSVGSNPGSERLIWTCGCWLIALQRPSKWKWRLLWQNRKMLPIQRSTVLSRWLLWSAAYFIGYWLRAGSHLPLGARQKAFRDRDSLADNVWILWSLIEDCKSIVRDLRGCVKGFRHSVTRVRSKGG